MTESERNEIITLLLLWTLWNEEVLQKMSNQKLLEEYDRHNIMDRG